MIRQVVLFLFTMSITCIQLAAQGFVIEDLHVDVRIQPNGIAVVKETIKVNFTEARHGIYRDIPLHYKGKSASSGDAIMLSNIEVVGDPVVKMHQSGLMRLRIGSANKTIKGKKTYQINYHVLGAVEQFKGAAEFSWNIIGDRWDTKIAKATVYIEYPFPVAQASKDIILRLKNKHVELNQAKHKLSSHSLLLDFPEGFKARQGASIALRFVKHDFPLQEVPAAVLSDNYYITSGDINVILLATGDAQVTEQYRIRSKKNSVQISRKISAYGQAHDRWGSVYPYPDLFTASWNEDLMSVETEDDIDYRLFSLIDLSSPNNKGLLEFNYLLKGAITNDQNKIFFQIDAGSFAGKVAIDTLTLHYSLPKGVNILGQDDMPGYSKVLIDNESSQFIRTSHLTGDVKQRILLSGLDPASFDYPIESLYADRLQELVSVEVVLQDDGFCTVSQHVMLQNKRIGSSVKYLLSTTINTSESGMDIGNPNLLSNRRQVRVNSLDLHPDYADITQSDARQAVSYDEGHLSKFRASYRAEQIYDGDKLIIPIYSLPNIPIGHLQVQVKVDAGEIIADIDRPMYFASESKTEVITNDGNTFLSIPVNKSAIKNTSLSLMSILRVNARLLTSLMIAGLLYLIWYVFGRDRKYDGSMKSHPPDYMTPAEAGYLWDGKLHGRDLISLIYQWAAKDLIIIEEVQKSSDDMDYVLEKQGNLPADAFEYEHILFNKLFQKNKTRVTISSLRNSFYKTMSKAKVSLKKEFEKRHLYEPFTRGIGTLFIIFGFLLFAFGLVLLGMGASRGDFSWSLPTLIVSMAMLFFGYYLPKKTALGSKYFIALQQFNAFIDEASPEELESLYTGDSNYFQNTLAYAIVLGKAREWAKRFDGLLTQAPSYYRGRRYDSFSSMLFTQHVLDGMHTMEKDFYSTPAPSGGSSSYSGGRSSSFSGGGGSFGGGGGSSW